MGTSRTTFKLPAKTQAGNAISAALALVLIALPNLGASIKEMGQAFKSDEARIELEMEAAS